MATELVIVDTCWAVDEDGTKYSFPIYAPSISEYNRLCASILPAIEEYWHAVAANVRAMAAAYTEAGGDGEALVEQYRVDPDGAMKVLVGEGLYKLRPRHLYGGIYVQRATPTDGHKGAIFEEHSSLKWIEV